LLVYFHMQPGMSGFGYSVPTGVPPQVTANRGPPQLAGPHPEQSLDVGVHCTAGGRDGVLREGQLVVHSSHEPLLHVWSPSQVPQTLPHPSLPHSLPPQLGEQGT